MTADRTPLTEFRRGEIFVQNLSVGIISGLQPARHRELEGLTSDGLLQRFLSVMLGPASLPRDCPSDDEKYSKLVHAMIALRPRTLTMTDHALGIMHDLRRHLFDLEQASGGMATGFQAFVGKLHGMAGRLAPNLHLAHDPKCAIHTGGKYDHALICKDCLRGCR